MKRSIFLILALLVAGFGVAVGTDLIEFSSDRTDRRVVILSVGVVVGLAALGFGSADSNHADEIDETTARGRAAAARRLQATRTDPASLPAKPGSLLKKRAEAQSAHDQTSGTGLDVDQLDLVATAPPATVPPVVTVAGDEIHDDAAPFGDDDVSIDDSDVTPQRVIVPVSSGDDTEPSIERELLELIDDEQRLEISDLVAAARASAEDHPPHDVVPTNHSVEPLKQLELRLADYDDDDLQRVVKESEAVVIAEMVRTGQLTSEGALTQQDIASMVFLAYTSEEMLEELRLRKSMDLPLALSEKAAAGPLDVSADESR